MGKQGCTLTYKAYCGWKTIRLSNGIIDLFIAPDLGGRIIQLRFNSREFFYVNSRHFGRTYPPAENCAAAGWKNYGGSKVWPAPQGWEGEGQWPGPPDPVLDGGAYAWRVLEQTPRCVAVYLESAPDPYTGLTLSRDIRIFENISLIQIAHKMRNTSLRRARWAIWQVTQHAVESGLAVYAPARRARQIYGDENFECAGHERENGVWKLEYANRVAKFAVEVERGWLASLRPSEQIALIEEFGIFPGKPYPNGAPAEVWVNGEGTYTITTGRGNLNSPNTPKHPHSQPNRIDMAADANGCDPFIETEVLSPLVDLDPGQEYSFSVTWRPTLIKDIDSKQLLGFVP